MLNRVEHEKSFITSGPDCHHFTKEINFCDLQFASLKDDASSFKGKNLNLQDSILSSFS